MPPVVVCPVCHLRNDVTARFCRQCGLPLGAPRDPVRGTTTRRADLPSERGAGIAAVVSLVAIVVIAGLAGYLVFRGFESVPTTAGAGATMTPPVGGAQSGEPQGPSPRAPTPSLRAASPEPTERGGVATRRPEAATDDPGETTEPEADPTARPTPDPLPTRTGWTCDDAAIQDPLGGRWRITGARWGRRDGYDRLTFDLARLEGSTRTGTVVRMGFVRPARAASRYDVAMPSGDRALVITFDGPLALRTDISAQPGLTALSSLTARADDEGVVHAVLGIEGDGCARLVANDWRTGDDDTSTAKLIIDIKR